MKKALVIAAGIVFSVIMVIYLLIYSAHYSVSDMEYFEAEYEKYAVSQTIGVRTEQLMDVTEQMMAYLEGDRDTLDGITAEVNGKQREFFNEREKAHMIDVKSLYLGAIRLMPALLAAIFILLAVSIAKGQPLFFKTAAVSSAAVCVGLIALVWLISMDFTRAFIIFHEIFFSNDLWILDEKTSLLINIVPEGFFMDTAVSIAMRFALSMAGAIASCIAAAAYIKNKQKGSE